ncbi:MAG: cell envelope integrity protein CreD [Bacteroidota bacterium]
MENRELSYFERISRWFRQSLTIKLASIGIIMLLLMIPNAMVNDLINERRWLQQSVVDEVGQKWGKAQTLVGPILSIPFTETLKKNDGKIVEIERIAYFLPENLRINGELLPEVRKRSLYKVNLYKADLQVSGNFGALGLDYLTLQPKQFSWEKAKVIFGIPDMAGIEDNIFLDWNDQKLRMQPGIAQSKVVQSGVSVPVTISGAKDNPKFQLNLKLRGSQTIHFAPIGKETVASLNSTWATPSFEGNFLPNERDISEAGFSAQWKVLDFNRNYPQQWIGEQNQLNHHTFGLKLFASVDEYTKNTRSAKYAFLLISLSFLVFFFFEIINKLNIHSIQYVFIGLAISVFYILLLSLSEHIGFNAAYWISTLATVGLITAYSASILNNAKRTGILAGILVALYTFIFIILQLEDFALLAGSIGLFAVLAVVMLMSRQIDWYHLKRASE